ncbi:MAG TPA: restriction endonuclease [Ramlibacter sp.]|nr:restriction endonuclease [Ramlibacter sp.]
MARRKKQSVADDIVAIVSRLPWWGGLLLALVSYFVFHAIASSPQPKMLRPEEVGAALPGMWLRWVAFAFQFAVPFLCVLGAAVSFFTRRKRLVLVEKTTASPSAHALNNMSWQEFEVLVAESFRLQGFDVVETGGGGADGGVDMVARRGKETFLVQCKQWRAFTVGVDVLRELYGVMAARGAAGGFVVTSGKFTSDAVAFAEGRNVRLVDGQRLFGLLQQAKAAKQKARASTPTVAKASVAPAATAPLCPVCNSAMVRRTAKKGSNAGAQFWGCSGFPQCRGTR